MSAPSDTSQILSRWLSSGSATRPVWARAVPSLVFVAGLALLGETAMAGVGVGVLAAGTLGRLLASSKLAALDLYDRFDALGAVPVMLNAACTLALGVSLGVSFTPWVFATVTVAAAAGGQVIHMWVTSHRTTPYRTGEVIWATVKYNGRDDTGAKSKQRPMLVMRDTGAGVDALYMTSRGDRYDGRDGWVRVTGTWDRKGRPSWVDVTRRLTVPDRRITQREAVLDTAQLDVVRAEARRRAMRQERR